MQVGVWGWERAKCGNGHSQLQAHLTPAERHFCPESCGDGQSGRQGLSKVATLEVTILTTGQLCSDHVSIPWLWAGMASGGFYDRSREMGLVNIVC